MLAHLVTMGSHQTTQLVAQPVGNAGTYVGRLAIRATGYCNLQTAHGTIQGIHVRYCRPLHRGDGYTYTTGKRAALPPQG